MSSVHNFRQAILGGLIAGTLVTGLALSFGASAQPPSRLAQQPTPAAPSPVDQRLDEISEQLRVIQGKLDKLLERQAQAEQQQPQAPAPRQIARSTVNGVTIRNQGRITLHSITVDQGSATITVNGERLGVVTAQPLYKDGRILRYEGTNQVTYEAVFSGNIVLTVTPGTDAPLKATVVYSR